MREAWRYLMGCLALRSLGRHLSRLPAGRAATLATAAAVVVADYLPRREEPAPPPVEPIQLTTDEAEWLMEMVRLRIAGQPIARAEGVQ